MSKSKVYDLTKQYNHRWKTDPRYRKNFDYDHLDFKDVPGDIRWMITMGPYDKSQYLKSENLSVQLVGKRILTGKSRSAILKLVK
ncbi:MAG: hypothetical protein B7Y39_10645 [Bdellovibrio sp. 28-41-41]|nr:MAG: hypothetical protein B7Y39_10645 [Bdellovibrio sp. 28-41-41]